MRRKFRITLFFLLLATIIGGLMIVLFAPFELKWIGIPMLILGFLILAIVVTAVEPSYEMETAKVVTPSPSE